MKKIAGPAKSIFLIACLLSIPVLGCAQNSSGSLPKFQREQLVEDFQAARLALEEGHSGIYRYTSKAELDRLFDEAAIMLNRPMDAYEFYRVLAPVVAAIKCGHTNVSLPDSVRQEINTRTPLLPLQVKVLNKKVYVFRDLATREHTLAGKEIRSVNGVPSSRLVESMLRAAPGDGDVETSRQLYIGGWRFGGNLVALMGINAPYDLVVRDGRGGREEKLRLEGLDLPKLREAWKAQYPEDQPPPQPAGEIKFLDEGRIAHMTIRGFGGFVDAEKKKGLKEFYKEAFGDIQAKRSKSLIIDLRNNGGGQDELGKLLLSYLIDEPFKYYDDLVINKLSFGFMKYTPAANPSAPVIPSKLVEQGKDGKFHAIGHPNWGLQQPNKPTFSGKVFILINGGSFSTTSEFLSQAHFRRRATFIGEESGGGYYGNSSGFMPRITLPNTKVTLQIPLMTYYMAVKGYGAASRGVMPDKPVAYSIAELLAGADKEQALAVKLARQQ